MNKEILDIILNDLSQYPTGKELLEHIKIDDEGLLLIYNNIPKSDLFCKIHELLTRDERNKIFEMLTNFHQYGNDEYLDLTQLEGGKK